MIILEIMMLVGVVALGLYASVSDCLYGIIKNKIILAFLTYAVLLNAIYYGFFVSDIICDYALNNAIVWCMVLALYFSDTWAGGDCKMCIAVAMLYPARYYCSINGQNSTLFMIVMLAFFIGYLYLVIDAIICLLSHKITVTKKYLANSLIRFFTSYLTALIYITGISLLLQALLPEGYAPNPALLIFVYMCIAWLVSSKKIFRNKYIWGGVLIIDIVLCFVFRVIPISTDYRLYLIIAVLLLLQIIIRLRNYRTVLASDIQPGMILSTASSITLMQAKVNCISEMSKENLGNRLTPEQAEMIRTWGTRYNVNLTIVRKIPFAGFIFLGTIIYFVIWSVLK